MYICLRVVSEPCTVLRELSPLGNREVVSELRHLPCIWLAWINPKHHIQSSGITRSDP